MIDKDGTNFEVDSQEVKERILNRSPWTTPASVLAQDGYVRTVENDQIVYDVPSAEALLSDNFLARHCFGVRENSNAPDQIGLTFRPTETRDVVDISGTIWLDRSSAELRQLDFSYTGEMGAGRGCSSISLCWRAGGQLSAGGSLSYSRLPSGEWIVSQWLLRTPSDDTEWRRGGAVIPLPPNAVVRRGRPMVLRPRLAVSEGAVGIAWRRGAEVYRDEKVIASIAQAAAKNAGRKVGHVDGRIP